MEIISTGYTIYFTSLAPTNPPSPSLFKDPSHETMLHQEIDALLRMGAIESIPVQDRGKGFYSRYFLVPEKSSVWRPILDLRLLNTHVKAQKFKMVMLPAIILSFVQGDWFSVLNLQDAYLHIAGWVDSKQFLHFIVGQDHLQYQVLPFGLSSALRVFLKVMLIVAAQLRSAGKVF